MADERRTIQPRASQGFTFKELLSDATDKPFQDITENDVANWAYANNWREKDVKGIVRGFKKFRKKDADFVLDNPDTFTVDGASMSGRRTGNKKGFDVGDLFGTGRDVSLLGGALEQYKSARTEETANELENDLRKMDIPTKPQSAIQSLPSLIDLPTGNQKGASGQEGTLAEGQVTQQVQKGRSPKTKTVAESQPDVIDDLSELSIDPLQVQGITLSSPLPRLMIGDRSVNPDFGDSGKVTVDVEDRLTELYQKANDPDTTPAQRAAIEKQITKLYLEGESESVKNEEKGEKKTKKKPIGESQKTLLRKINAARRDAFGSDEDSPANKLVQSLQNDYERIYGIKIK